MKKSPSNYKFLSKKLGTSLGAVIEKMTFLCECPTSLICKIFLSVSLLLGVSTFQTLKVILVSIFIVQKKHFLSWNDQILFILVLLKLFMVVTAVSLILFPRRSKLLRPHTYEIVNCIYYFTVFTKYLSDQIE